MLSGVFSFLADDIWSLSLFWFQAHHLRCLNDFIEAQVTYFAQCQQYMTDLQRQLGRWVLGQWQAFLEAIATCTISINTNLQTSWDFLGHQEYLEFGYLYGTNLIE